METEIEVLKEIRDTLKRMEENDKLQFKDVHQELRAIKVRIEQLNK